jgi:hypothetical protein
MTHLGHHPQQIAFLPLLCDLAVDKPSHADEIRAHGFPRRRLTIELTGVGPGSNDQVTHPSSTIVAAPAARAASSASASTALGSYAVPPG